MVSKNIGTFSTQALSDLIIVKSITKRSIFKENVVATLFTSFD